MKTPRENMAPLRIFRLAALLVAASYVMLGLLPPQWQPPARLPNGAVRTAGGLDFSTPGIARTASPPHWLNPAIRSNRLSIGLLVRSHDPAQGGPARIFTVSRNVDSRNLTIGQREKDLVVRLRRSGSSFNGTPELVVPDVFRTGRWRRVEVHVSPGRLTVRVDSIPAIDEALTDEPMADWDTGHRVALGNEWTGERPWLGEVREAIVRTGDLSADCVAAREMLLPASYWSGLRFQWFPAIRDPAYGAIHLRDAVLNFVGFVLLGGLLAWSFEPRRWLRIVVACSALSLAVEGLQICLPDHFLSLSDWILNTAGAGTGAWLAYRTGRHLGPGSAARSGRA